VVHFAPFHDQQKSLGQPPDASRHSLSSSVGPRIVTYAGSRIHIRAATIADPVGELRNEWQAQRMKIEEWWPKLDSATREWLVANNGDVVPITILGQIAEAGGDVTSDALSIGDNGPGGFVLSDAAVDWIEETANHETDSDG